MELSVKDVYLLDFYNGRIKDYTIYESQYSVYGADYKKRVQWLLENGYFTFENDEEALMHLTNKELQDILKANLQKSSGVKKVLVQRIMENVSREEYISKVEHRYKITDKGKNEIEDKAIYLESKNKGYGFLETEIAHAENEFKKQGNFDKDEVLLFLFNKKIDEQKSKENYVQLKNSFSSLSDYFVRRGKLEDALKTSLLSIYIDFSGMNDKNNVSTYENSNEYIETNRFLNEAFFARDLSSNIISLNVDVSNLAELLREALCFYGLRLPFQYYDDDVFCNMIIDALNGEKDILVKYEKYRNVPEGNNPNYKLCYHCEAFEDEEFLEDDEDNDDGDGDNLFEDISRIIDSYEDENINEENLIRLKNYLKNNLAKYKNSIIITIE